MLSSLLQARSERLPPVPDDGYRRSEEAAILAESTRLFEEGRHLEAAQCLEPLIAENPDNGYPLIVRAGIFASGGRTQDAVECLRIAEMRPMTIAYLADNPLIAPNLSLRAVRQIAQHDSSFAAILHDLRLLRRAAVRVAVSEPQCLISLVVGASMMGRLVGEEYSRIAREGLDREAATRRLEMHRGWTLPTFSRVRRQRRFTWLSPYRLAIDAGIAVGEARSILRGKPIPESIADRVRRALELGYRREWHSIRPLVALVPNALDA